MARRYVRAKPKRPNQSRYGMDEITFTQKLGAALDMRRVGMRYDQIAAKLDLKESQVGKMISEALSRMVVEPGEDVAKLEMDRLDIALFEVITILKKSDNQRTRLMAVDRLIGLQDRRAKYLGLDRKAPDLDPEKHEVIVKVIGENISMDDL